MAKVALVTGAAGFLGYHLCMKLKSESYDVYGVDDLTTGLKKNAQDLKKAGIHFFQKDITHSWASWAKKLPAKVDLVFHFASPASPPIYQEIPLKTMASNSIGLYYALEFATARQGKCIFASTSEVYGSPEVSPQPETYWGSVNSYGPRACYDESKRFGEALIYSFNQENKTTHGLVRIFNTYGPRMNPNDGRVIINFLVQLLKGESLTIHGKGTQTRSFCYVSDLIDGIYKYSQKNKLTQPINLGNQKEFTILELAKSVQKLSKKKLSIKFIARPVDDPPRRKPDLKVAKKVLEWSPKVNLDTGLKKTLEELVTFI